MSKKVRVLEIPNLYNGEIEIGRVYEISGENSNGVEVEGSCFLYPNEFEWVKQVRFLKNSQDCEVIFPKSYIGRVFDVVYMDGDCPVIRDNGHYYGFRPDEFEWVDDNEQPYESKLSLDEKDDSNYKAEETVIESSNSLKKHGYKPTVNEVSYYEISIFDASYILHEHLESNVGYEISGVWFDDETKTFKAHKKVKQ